MVLSGESRVRQNLESRAAGPIETSPFNPARSVRPLDMGELGTSDAARLLRSVVLLTALSQARAGVVVQS